MDNPPHYSLLTACSVKLLLSYNFISRIYYYILLTDGCSIDEVSPKHKIFGASLHACAFIEIDTFKRFVLTDIIVTYNSHDIKNYIVCYTLHR